MANSKETKTLEMTISGKSLGDEDGDDHAHARKNALDGYIHKQKKSFVIEAHKSANVLFLP